MENVEDIIGGIDNWYYLDSTWTDDSLCWTEFGVRKRLKARVSEHSGETYTIEFLMDEHSLDGNGPWQRVDSLGAKLDSIVSDISGNSYAYGAVFDVDKDTANKILSICRDFFEKKPF